MKITIDTSVLLAVCANEPGKDRWVALAEGGELLAPGSVQWEVGNALTAMLKRGRATLAEAQAVYAVYSSIPLKFVEVDMALVLALADRYRMYAYDAYLLACAMRYNTPLLTADRGLKNVAKQEGILLLGEES